MSSEIRKCPACTESASGLCSWHRDYGKAAISPSMVETMLGEFRSSSMLDLAPFLAEQLLPYREQA